MNKKTDLNRLHISNQTVSTPHRDHAFSYTSKSFVSLDAFEKKRDELRVKREVILADAVIAVMTFHEIQNARRATKARRLDDGHAKIRDSAALARQANTDVREDVRLRLAEARTKLVRAKEQFYRAKERITVTLALDEHAIKTTEDDGKISQVSEQTDQAL